MSDRRASRNIYYLYRCDDLDWPIREASATNKTHTLEVLSKRRWPIQEGDSLVLTWGRGLELRFVAIAPVLKVERLEPGLADSPKHRVRVTVEPPRLLSEDLTLGRLMYSLVVIANCRRPWLHLRHRCRLPRADAETLLGERIAWDRTIFFGLLRELPERWREFLEAESRARHAVAGLHEMSSGHKPPSEPVRELLDLVTATLISPASIGADAYARWVAALGQETIKEVEVAARDGRSDSWSLRALLATAATTAGPLLHNWRALSDLPVAKSLTGREFVWRPHRW